MNCSVICLNCEGTCDNMQKATSSDEVHEVADPEVLEKLQQKVEEKLEPSEERDLYF